MQALWIDDDMPVPTARIAALLDALDPPERRFALVLIEELSPADRRAWIEQLAARPRAEAIAYVRALFQRPPTTQAAAPRVTHEIGLLTALLDRVLFLGVLAKLTPSERRLAQMVEEELPPADRRLWLHQLAAMPLADAAARVRALLRWQPSPPRERPRRQGIDEQGFEAPRRWTLPRARSGLAGRDLRGSTSPTTGAPYAPLAHAEPSAWAAAMPVATHAATAPHAWPAAALSAWHTFGAAAEHANQPANAHHAHHAAEAASAAAAMPPTSSGEPMAPPSDAPSTPGPAASAPAPAASAPEALSLESLQALAAMPLSALGPLPLVALGAAFFVFCLQSSTVAPSYVGPARCTPPTTKPAPTPTVQTVQEDAEPAEERVTPHEAPSAASICAPHEPAPTARPNEATNDVPAPQLADAPHLQLVPQLVDDDPENAIN